MVMMRGCSNGFGFAVLFVAGFVGGFDFNSSVNNIMLSELFTNCTFEFLSVTFTNDMQCGVVLVTVHTPNVHMMDVFNFRNFKKMFF